MFCSFYCLVREGGFPALPLRSQTMTSKIKAPFVIVNGVNQRNRVPTRLRQVLVSTA
jgi:hypothetical protein